MLVAADESYLLADSSKAAERAMCYYAEPSEFAKVFSDVGLANELRGALVAAGAELVCVAAI
jgi:DeoR/GlpR family transcriptional regulator of sugar metabolism